MADDERRQELGSSRTACRYRPPGIHILHDHDRLRCWHHWRGCLLHPGRWHDMARIGRSVLANQPEPCSGDASFCTGNTGSEAVTGIRCWTADHCIIATPGTGSISWQSGRNPPSDLQYAGGGIWATLDGGRTWSPESIPEGVRVWALACGSGDNCWAAGETTSSGDNPPGVILRLVN